jgi:quinol monooxygenase YgiN
MTRIKRIVKLTIEVEKRELFISLYLERAKKIASFEGCISVDLLEDRYDKAVFFTVSNWQSEEQLNAYRDSDFFETTWKKVKPLFAEKALAWTLDTL